jgi:hypothetical protein
MEMPRPSHYINFPATNDWCRQRPELVLLFESPRWIIPVLGMRPQTLAGCFRETTNALDRLGLLQLGVREINTALGHDGG